MPYDPETAVFSTLGAFVQATRPSPSPLGARMVHCINPFSADPESEHHRAQQVTLASMTRARQAAAVLEPELSIKFAKVTLQDAFRSPLIDFDEEAELERSVLDLKDFEIKRPLPLIMDILTAIDVAPDDILIFTNVDIALAPGFYPFVAGLFRRGADCAIINRRTISNDYVDVTELALMACEAGEPHPGFDCFAFSGALQKRLHRYESSVGIGGVMLPLVHQLLAFASQPVVLLDAHATFHLGDDKTWTDPALSDYTDHNRAEVDRIFSALIGDEATKARLVSRLSDIHKYWIFPERLQILAGVREEPEPDPPAGLLGRLGLKRGA